MLLSAYAACLHCISLAHMSFNLLQQQMHYGDLLMACSSTALFQYSTSLVHVLFVCVLTAACDCSLSLQATSAQHRQQSTAQDVHELSRAAATGRQLGDADGQVERRASGNEGDEQHSWQQRSGSRAGSCMGCMAISAGTADCAPLLVEEVTLQVSQPKFLRQRATTDRSCVLQAHARHTSLSASQQHLHHHACMPRPCSQQAGKLA